MEFVIHQRQHEGHSLNEGLRQITVRGTCYRWRFNPHNGKVVVIPIDRSGPQLNVSWGWQDWLEPEGPGPEPNTVTPAFVADAIQFALDNGWTGERLGTSIVLRYEEGHFQVDGDRS